MLEVIDRQWTPRGLGFHDGQGGLGLDETFARRARPREGQSGWQSGAVSERELAKLSRQVRIAREIRGPGPVDKQRRRDRRVGIPQEADNPERILGCGRPALAEGAGKLQTHASASFRRDAGANGIAVERVGQTHLRTFRARLHRDESPCLQAAHSFIRG